MLAKLSDPDRFVQEAVCTSINQIFRSAEADTLAGQPALAIVNAFSAAVDSFKGTTLINFFDCMGAFAEQMGDHLKDKDLVDVLMPLLAKKWVLINDDDRRILPMFECFEYVISSIGSELAQQYIQPILQRCFTIL
jgi:hypothetical protein